MSGVSLLKIQAWAGHSDPKMTKDHYAHLVPEYDSDIEHIARRGYTTVTQQAGRKKGKNRYPLKDSGLSRLTGWWAQRGCIRTGLPTLGLQVLRVPLKKFPPVRSRQMRC